MKSVRSRLTPAQLTAFDNILARGNTEGTSSKEVTEELQAAIPDVNFSESTIRKMMRRARKGIHRKSGRAADEKQENKYVESDKEATFDGFIRKRVVTVEDAIEKCGADMSKWDVEKFECTAWEVGAKTKGDYEYNEKNQLIAVRKELEVTPLWRVHVKFKPKVGWSAEEFRALLLDDMRELAPSYQTPCTPHRTEPIMVELSIFDAHFGKLAWGEETGQEYNLEICRTRYLNAARDLLQRAAKENPERICMVVGNDFFHVNHKNKTYAGTLQDVDGRWQQAYRIGKDCVITILEEAAMIAPVDAICIPGNHDKEKVFHLGELLDARFTHHKTVNIVNTPDPFNYYRWGKNLIGFVHGENHMNDKKRSELPAQMLTDRPTDCGETVWREWHLGHLHSEEELVWKYRTVYHIRDFAVRVLPSLCSTDAWHRWSGYQSVLSAECHLYHKDSGRCGYLVHCTEPTKDGV